MSTNASRYELPIVEASRELLVLEKHIVSGKRVFEVMQDVQATIQTECASRRQVLPDDEDGACSLRARLEPHGIGFTCLSELCPAKSEAGVNFPDMAAEAVAQRFLKPAETGRANQQ